MRPFERKVAIKAEYSKVPGAKIYTRDQVPFWSYLHDRSLVFAGVPTFRELEWLRWLDEGGDDAKTLAQDNRTGHLFFSPISPVTGKDARSQVDIAKRIMHKYGFDNFSTFYIGPREGHHIVTILFNRNDPAEKERPLTCLREMIDEAAKLGYGEYRTHIACQDQISKLYNWGGGRLWQLHEQIKDALDPNGILQPGRYGVWGKEYRGKGYELQGGEKHSDPQLR